MSRWVAILVLLAACGGSVTMPTVDAGADAAVVADLAACTLSRPYSTSDTVCNACASLHCCVEVDACYAATSCDDDYTNCYLGCGLGADPDAGQSQVQSCIASCGSQYPDGKTRFNAAIDCVSQHCPTQCS